ncbi:MAG: MotA/TolQ/ExbB proton channel family protein [Bacteroidales bacterium]
MKKLISLFSMVALLTFGTANIAQAQDTTNATATTEQVDTTEQVADAAVAEADTEVVAESQSFNQVLKQKFIEGGALWMTPILLVLILGLTLVIERIIYLNLATTNTDKLLTKVENALNEGGIDAAKEVCRSTKGPVASIFYQGLTRMDEGVEMVEKSIVSYGGVQMGKLEKNLSWIALTIAIAPMLGFLGTVVGMVQAFDQIEAAGDISPTVVAGGMKVALLTTVFGLIVAIMIQIFYNYLSTKIESIVNAMEDSSITFMDLIVKYSHKK